jgi:threonylcarbamoyladenosine tRNA methylthiotransferase MtaB
LLILPDSICTGGVCSKDPKILMSEAEKLAEHGFKEIILSGIHTASYGIDLKNDWNLLKVIEEINKIDGIERIRIGSIDPTFFNEDVIKRISSIEKLCPHFHLSLQSGSDRTLKRMNRHYDTALYRKITEELRENINDVSITTDVIVGFPGESEEEFNETYDFLRDIKLSRMHIFKYSPREGTKAAAMKDQVSGNIKDERSSSLEKLNKELEHDFMSRFIGRDMKVLYEQHLDTDQNMFEGYTSNYIKVVSKFDEDLRDKIMNTEMISVENEHILGLFVIKNNMSGRKKFVCVE